MSDIKVLIVDDEAIIRRSLRNKIKWNELGFTIMGEAKNAEEAYEIIKQTKPEVILLDMKMPGMGGMNFLEILNREFPMIKVIIISGYSDFEYLKKALNCGAHDYLLKPVSREDLENAVTKCSQVILKDRNENIGKINDRMILNENLSLVKEAILNKLISSSNTKPELILKKLLSLGIKFDCRFYSLVLIRINNYEKTSESFSKDTGLMFFTIDNVSTEIAAKHSSCVGFKNTLIDNEFILLLGFDDSEGAIKSKVLEIVKNISSSLEQYIKISISFGVSEIFPGLSHIHSAYRNAIFSLQQKKSLDDSITNENNIKLINSFVDSNFEREIAHFIDSFNKTGLLAFISNTLEKAKSCETFLSVDMQNLCLKILLIIEKYMSRFDITISKAVGMDIISFNYLADIRNWDEARNSLNKILDIIFNYMSNQKGMDSKRIIIKAKEYIDKNYFEDINLNFISSRYFLNATYFCEVFKKETGYTFNDYLNHVRIEKSKEFISNSNLKLKEIAELVGFEEQSYFSIVFKKYIGISPKDYKNNLI